MTTGTKTPEIGVPEPVDQQDAVAATTAVVIAPAAPLQWGNGTVLGRLLDDLHALGIRAAHVLTRAAAQEAVARASAGAPLPVSVQANATAADDLRALAGLARELPGRLLVLDGDIVVSPGALANLLADPRAGTGVLCGADLAGPGHPLRTDRGRVISAGSGFHEVSNPNALFLGALLVSDRHAPELANCADALAGLPAGDRPDTVALALVGLVRSGVPVLSSSWIRDLFWARPNSPGQAERARRELAHFDEDRALLDAAVKANDGFFTTFFVSPYSKHVARWAARRGLSPNAVTTASMAIGILAAAAFATGERSGLIAGAVLAQIAFMTDCVDGQLARYARDFSKLGAWLDSILDRSKEYVIFAGLAIGAERAGDDAWLLAAAALTLQTVRHMVEFSYGVSHQQLLATAWRPPLDHPSDRRARPAAGVEQPRPARLGPAQRALAAWAALLSRPATRWGRKIAGFPIGERFAAISVCTALWDARTTFIVFLVWGGVAALITVGGRLVRSVA